MIANANGLLAASEISTMTGKNDQRTAAESILPAALNSFSLEGVEDGGGGDCFYVCHESQFSTRVAVCQAFPWNFFGMATIRLRVGFAV